MQELDRLVRAREAAKALGIGLSTFWLRVSKGIYPSGTLISPRTRCWKASSIQALIDRLAAGSGIGEK